MRTFLIFILTSILSFTQAQENAFDNPIIPGSHPDPSICYDGEYFYIVNSTFELYPGLPINRSKDLVNWELIGYGLHRQSQCNAVVNLVDVQSDGGIHAPTIRYHEGIFYIITTNVYYHEKKNKTDFVNFIITAKDPAGPWSEPHVLEGAPGIDPDIFFDDDGRVWYVGTHLPDAPNFSGEGEIWLQEIDLDNWKLIGERSFLWRGACGGVWAEGPHMYKRNGYYYLMIAEGGTSFNHAVMIAVGDNIKGPFISNERNPIFTSRHLSYDNWVHSTGHADLIELNDGRWYMVALGVRGEEKRGSNMGRETFLLPVVWEKEPFEWKEIQYEWPVVAQETGKLEPAYDVPFKGTTQKRSSTFSDDFESEELDLNWNFRRVPSHNMYSLTKRESHLRLNCSKTVFSNRTSTSFIGFRQTESNFEYLARMSFNPSRNGSEAGITVVQKDDNYITFTIIREEGSHFIQAVLAMPNSKPKVLKKKELVDYDGSINLQVLSLNHEYIFVYSMDNNEMVEFHRIEAHHLLSKGYTGAFLGLYATGNGTKTNDYSDFDFIEYVAF